ncbi:MAG TPA: type II secretion system F family protein [Tepidisphaeraceae bacterium]|jgi:type II secretory pathway component PulF
MAVFAYTALAKDGRRTTGTLTAESRSAALSQMTRQGLSPVKIDEAKDAAAAAKKAAAAAAAARGGGKVPGKAVESFTRELANLLAGGVSLARSLSLLRREASNPNAKKLWGDIHDDVVGGTALADALAKHPRNFSTVYVAMVRAGEAGGFLDVVLTQISDFRGREQDLKGKVKAALVYPIVLGVLAIGVLIFMLTFFIPRFSPIFAQFGGELPLITRVIIALSNVVKNYGLFVAIGLVVIVVVVKRALATDVGKRRLEVMMLSTPVLGQIISHFALVRFSRMLGTLVTAGVPLIASLRVAREAIGNQTLADTVSHAIEEVQRGEALSKALGNSPKLFPPSVVEMIAVAEETGRLDKELLRLSAAYESDLDRQLRLLVSIAEPMMLFLMAGVIGTVVIGMLLPLFSLSEVVH